MIPEQDPICSKWCNKLQVGRSRLASHNGYIQLHGCSLVASDSVSTCIHFISIIVTDCRAQTKTSGGSPEWSTEQTRVKKPNRFLINLVEEEMYITPTR